MSLLPFLVIFNTTKVGFHSIKEVENLPKKALSISEKALFSLFRQCEPFKTGFLYKGG